MTTVTVDSLQVSVQRVGKRGDPLPLPTIQTQGSSGCDLYADIQETLELHPGDRKLVPTGIAIALPKGFEAQCRPRSGWAFKHGITLANSPGTIDSDYRGELKVILINLGKEVVKINRGDRIAQMVVQRVYSLQWKEVETLNETERSSGGFGHTGKRDSNHARI